MARRIAVRRGPVCSMNFRVEDAARHHARVHAADLRHLVQRVLGDGLEVLGVARLGVLPGGVLLQ